MKQAAARQMRHTAQLLDADHPEMVAGDHVRDAAKVLEHGSLDGAKRHLDAAIELLTPRNLMRHGITDDDGHTAAKHHMHQVFRHRLAVQDIEDVTARNAQLRAAVRGQAGPEGPPDGNRRSSAAPGQPGEPIAAASPMLDLAGPKGYVHGWKYVGAGQAPALKPLGIKVNRKGYMRADIEVPGSMPGHAHGFVGHKGDVFGRHLSLKEAVGASQALGTPSAKERADRLAGVQAGFRKQLTKPQRVIFDKLIKRGRAPHGAFVIARAFQPEVLRAGLANYREAIELFNPLEPRGRGGKWERKGTPRPLPVGHSGMPVNRTPTIREMLGFRSRRQRQRIAVSRELRRRGLRPARSKADLNPFRTDRLLPLATELSARTAMLERTPAPRGRPGGPGLYDVKGLGHTAYLQQIVKALIDKRGMEPGKAYAIARGAIRKWMRGGGHVHPEVRAAAGRAEAGELAKQARAHAHAIGPWEVADSLIELATIELYNPYHAQPGPGGGRFTSAQGAGGAKQQQAARKREAKQVARRKQGLRPGQAVAQRRRIAAERHTLQVKIAGIRRQIAALQAMLPKTSRGKAGKAAGKAKSAAATKAAAAKKSAGATPRKKGVAARKLSPATIHARISALQATLRADIAQLRAL
jgi:hypothetical protein